MLAGVREKPTSARSRPADISILSIVFGVAALISAISAQSLRQSGTPLDRIWVLVPSVHHALAAMGATAISSLVLFCIAALLAAYGLWRCFYWGYLIAFLVFFSLVAVESFYCLINRKWWEAVASVAIGAVLLLYFRRRSHIFEPQK